MRGEREEFGPAEAAANVPVLRFVLLIPFDRAGTTAPARASQVPQLAPLPCSTNLSAPAHWTRSTTIYFDNATSQTVDVYWISPTGPVFYQEIPSGAAEIQPTYANNAWEITDTSGNCLTMFRATGTAATATISAS
jgi:hypothetical protein